MLSYFLNVLAPLELPAFRSFTGMKTCHVCRWKANYMSVLQHSLKLRQLVGWLVSRWFSNGCFDIRGKEGCDFLVEVSHQHTCVPMKSTPRKRKKKKNCEEAFVIRHLQ